MRHATPEYRILYPRNRLRNRWLRMVPRTICSIGLIFSLGMLGLVACKKPAAQRDVGESSGFDSKQSHAMPVRWPQLGITGMSRGSSSSFDPTKNSNVLPGDVRGVLDNAEHITLYSIDPRRPGDPTLPAPHGKIQDYRICGSAEVPAGTERKALLDSLYKAIDEEFVPEGTARVVMCFDPHHAIRATRHERSIDLVICFMCSTIHIHDSNKPSVLVSKSAEPTFDATLKRLGLPTKDLLPPLPPPPEGPESGNGDPFAPSASK